MDGFQAYRKRILEARKARRAAESEHTGQRQFDGGSILVDVVDENGVVVEEGVRVFSKLEEGGALRRLYVGTNGRRYREFRLGAKSVQGKVVAE